MYYILQFEDKYKKLKQISLSLSLFLNANKKSLSNVGRYVKYNRMHNVAFPS